MRRFPKSIAILILTAGAPMTVAAQTSSVSKAAGRYVAGAYQGITNSVIGGPYTTGTVNIQLAHPWIETPDGRTIYPYSTSLPVTIFNSSGSETLTPSAAVSSGTFSNTTIIGTFGTATSTSDTTHTASVSLGQPIQIQVTSQASETLAGAVCTVQLN